MRPGAGSLTRYRNTFHRGVFLTLFFAIFTTVTGVGIVVPLLPIYASSLGAAGIYVGMIFGAFSLSRTMFLPFFGRVSDRKGRKPFIVAGLSVYVIVGTAFIFSKGIESLIVLRFIQGAGSAMIMPVVQAYVGEITPAGSEGYTMGLFNLSMFLSLSIGPLMGGVIKDVWSMDAAFACMGMLSGIGLALCLLFLPPRSEEVLRPSKKEIVPWSGILKDRGMISIFMVRYAYTACIGIIWCFLPLFADLKFSLSGSRTGLLVTLGVFISGLLQMPMGHVADRMDKRILIFAGGMISTAGMMLLYKGGSFRDLVTGVCVFGIGGGISMPAVMACAVVKGDEKKAMGSVMSIMTVAHSLGMMTGSMAAGAAMDYFSLGFSFPCGAVIMAAGTFCYLALAEKKHGFAIDT